MNTHAHTHTHTHTRSQSTLFTERLFMLHRFKERRRVGGPGARYDWGAEIFTSLSPGYLASKQDRRKETERLASFKHKNTTCIEKVLCPGWGILFLFFRPHVFVVQTTFWAEIDHHLTWSPLNFTARSLKVTRPSTQMYNTGLFLGA